MTLQQTINRFTPEEYLRREHDATERHQYYLGEIFAMAGGSPDHSLIISNVNGEIRARLKGKPCRAYESNLRIRIPRTTLYTYPDISVLCGDRQFDPLDIRKETVLNPTLLVEVLSPTAEAWDRGGKFENYRQIESLREYVLVSSEKALVETFLRQPGGAWIFSAAAGGEATVRLNSLGVELPLAEVYSGVEFTTPSADKAPA